MLRMYTCTDSSRVWCKTKHEGDGSFNPSSCPHIHTNMYIHAYSNTHTHVYITTYTLIHTHAPTSTHQRLPSILNKTISVQNVRGHIHKSGTASHTLHQHMHMMPIRVLDVCSSGRVVQRHRNSRNGCRGNFLCCIFIVT